MWILTLLLGSVCIGALVADPVSDLQECAQQMDFEKVNELAKSPSTNELQAVCPMMLGYMDCVIGVAETALNVTFADIPDVMPGTDVARGATFLLNLRGVLQDLCTEGSDLFKAAAEHASCFDSMPTDEGDQCLSHALMAYETYRELQNNVEEATGENFDLRHKQCMVEAYRSACTAARIYDHCGQGAFDLYQQVVKRTTILKVAICSEKDLEELQTKFSDSLDLESDKKELFRLAFDVRKRRK